MALSAPDVLSAAGAAGFDSAAVLPLDAVAEASLDGWLAGGLQGEMKYLERHAHARRDPRSAFPGYESVAIVIAEYGDPGPNPTDPRLGNLSRYALSDNYHATLKGRLLSLLADLQSRFPALRGRALVDANPLNEKVLARLAGLGFVGKHSNLIRERRGSWFFCGVLLLSERLEAREPMAKNRCGTCTRCITACPTGAIVEPYVVDARLCISYLTIELRGPIPRHLRSAIGNRIFGCDDCQAVCPWNRFASREPTEAFRPRDGLQGRSLAAWLELEEPAFETLFRGSAVLRTGYEGFLRNVLVACGNSRDSELRDPVVARLFDTSATIRSTAAWALGQLGLGDHPKLAELLAGDPDSGVREEARATWEEAQTRIRVPPNSKKREKNT